MTLRPATPEDAERANEWSRGHGRNGFLTEALPPIGCVVEDDAGPMACVWAHCSCNIGMAFLECLSTRPGLTLAQARTAGALLMDGIASAVKPLGYNVLIAYALPACARYLTGMGWLAADERPKIAMVKTI